MGPGLCWSRPQLSTGERWGTPWTSPWKDRQPFTFTPRGDLEWSRRSRSTRKEPTWTQEEHDNLYWVLTCSYRQMSHVRVPWNVHLNSGLLPPSPPPSFLSVHQVIQVTVPVWEEAPQASKEHLELQALTATRASPDGRGSQVTQVHLALTALRDLL